MSYMKMELENLVQNEIAKRSDILRLLSLRTKYSMTELCSIWKDLCYDHFMFGEELDWDHFVTVTLEQDW